MRLAWLLVLLAVGCKESDPYLRAMQEVSEGGDTRARALLRIREHWERQGPLAMPGAGPRVLTKQEVALNDQILELLEDPDELVAGQGSGILPYLRAPGFDERLFRCARVLHPHCLAAVRIVADDTTMRAYLPFLDVDGAASVDAAIMLGSIGRKGIPYLQLAIQRGTDVACGRAIFKLWEFLAKDEFLDQRLLADPLLAPESLATLRLALAHPGWRCREQAALYIAQFDPAKRDVLTPLLEDPSAAVRDAARAGIDGIKYEGRPVGHKEPGDP